MRHVHADLIHAWAEGAIIQKEQTDKSWLTIPNPFWDSNSKYRIKPRSFIYRTFLWKDTFSSQYKILSCTKEEHEREPRNQCKGFVKWISDWEEVPLD